MKEKVTELYPLSPNAGLVPSLRCGYLPHNTAVYRLLYLTVCQKRNYPDGIVHGRVNDWPDFQLVEI